MKIIEVRLKTGDLYAQRLFYQQVLGLPLLDETADLITFQAGASRLTFELEADFQGMYHLAFDIPENQIKPARNWLAARAPISREGDEDIVHFPHWNAHSLYFFDPAGNVLEYIARHNQPNASDRLFSEASLLSISEIGLASDDVEQTVETLHEGFGLGVYNGPAGETFAAVGDELGLFIVVKRGRIWFSSRNNPAELWPMTVTIAGNSGQHVHLPGLPCHINTVQMEAP